MVAEILTIVEVILESLLAFVIRIGLWLFVAALAPNWAAALFLIAIILIPVFAVVLDDVSYFYQPIADIALVLAALLLIHRILDWKASLALVALFGLPLAYNVYL